MKKPSKKEPWVLPRHRVVRFLFGLVLAPYTHLRYRVRITPFSEQKDRQYVVLYNHQTAFDQFFVALSLRGAVYYLATEDIFSLGWLSSALRWLVAPIPIRKQTSDLQAVRTCIRVVREGGTIAIAPEGNRTYSGRTGYIKPSIIKLIRVLKLPVAIFLIEDGYGVQPRWASNVRRGVMRAGVRRVIEPEEYSAMSDEQFYELLCQSLSVDEAQPGGPFIHSNSAEYLERVIYVCPYCGLSEFESHGDTVECKTCHRQVRYLPSKQLEGVGFQFPFSFMADWYDYQCDFVNQLDLTTWRELPVFRDTARLSRVVLYKQKVLLKKQVDVQLFGDRICIGEDLEFPFDRVDAVTVLGRNKLNIYADGQVWQLKGSVRFNALKYVNFYHRFKNICEGDGNGKFLGL